MNGDLIDHQLSCFVLGNKILFICQFGRHWIASMESVHEESRESLVIRLAREKGLQGSPITTTLLTARPHLQTNVAKYHAKAVMTLVSPCRDDILRYLEMKLELDSERHPMNGRLREDIMTVIPERMLELRVGECISPSIAVV
ncbi:hypothetical protein L873DRAFT_352507 [Choiromyces venosus 120613-1]|uniref:Uncharacterized protein n=1 Tax=Choiromyces venosus 120613-1 TaxID=1336337 RepID=A0A3N4IXZ7_9PEZI|nr:hypothetical protein L873DRAFT_352507 [Choiromyces venosus 120613-1]